jgi:hypothetical protein
MGSGIERLRRLKRSNERNYTKRAWDGEGIVEVVIDLLFSCLESVCFDGKKVWTRRRIEAHERKVSR